MTIEPRLGGLLLVISGPGAVGKDTVIERLKELDLNLRSSVSFTTRPRREYEVDDVHYTFVTQPRFHELIGRGELLEYAQVNGHFYGTSKTRVEKLQSAGHDVILKIEVRGANQVRQKRPDGIFIFLTPPSMDELMVRRHRRGAETEDEMEQRQRLAEWEMSHAKFYDHMVVNDDVDRVAREVLEVVQDARKVRQRGQEAL